MLIRLIIKTNKLNMKKQIELEKYGVVDLTLTDERDTNGGFAAAAAVGAGLLGFGAGLIIGVVVVAGVIYLMK